MNEKKRNGAINELFRRAKWLESGDLLEREREAEPKNHWLITQLGVTKYEQAQYEDALKLFLASLEIVSDCPLTLWNLAGTLDALGKYTGAMSIYLWLLQANKSPEDDPCWENRQWTDALKTDCVYRIGVCFQHLGKKQKAEDCYRQYLDLLSIGIEGSYSIDDVKRKMQCLHAALKPGRVKSAVQKAVNETLQISGIERPNGRRRTPPAINIPELIAGGRRAASKK